MSDKQTAEEPMQKLIDWIDKEILINPYYDESARLRTGAEMVKVKATELLEEYASQPSAGLEIDTFPFCERGGKWFYCYKDIKGLNQHSKLFDSWGEAIQSYNEWHFVKADDIPTPSAGLGDVKLPDFLYKSGNEICIGYHGDSLVTDEWNEWLEKHLPKLKALTSLPSGYCRWVKASERLPVKYSSAHWRDSETKRPIADHHAYDRINFKNKPESVEWLEESPSTIDARKIASDAWDAAIERFCYENGSEFVEGKPLKKFDYLSNL